MYFALYFYIASPGKSYSEHTGRQSRNSTSWQLLCQRTGNEKWCSEPLSIFLTLPASPHEGYKLQFSWKSSPSSYLLHGMHMQPCIWDAMHHHSGATVTDESPTSGRAFYIPCFNFILWACPTAALSIQIYKIHLYKLQDLLVSEFILFNLKMK